MPLNKNIEAVVRDIARCQNIDWDTGLAKNNVCTKVVSFQNVESNAFRDEYHIPEPFSGKIDESKYLILDSNPSFNRNEKPAFPKYAWSNEKIISYFYNRMDYYSNQRYLNACMDIIKWIYPGNIIRPKDIAMTEIVHCKSRSENGVATACRECISSFFKRVLDLFPNKCGNCIVLCGKHVQDCIKADQDLYTILMDKELNGVKIVMSYHPAYHWVKTEVKKARVERSAKENDWREICK